MEYYLTLRAGKLERHKTDCPLTLEQMQQGVDGYIECAGRFQSVEGKGRGITVWANEEGLLRGMPFTCYLASLSAPPQALVGPLVICADDENGDSVGLTERELNQIAHGGVVLAVLEPDWMPEGELTTTREVVEAVGRTGCAPINYGGQIHAPAIEPYDPAEHQ